MVTVLAAVIVFVALVIPDTVGRPRPGVFLPGAVLRIPLEGIVGAALLIVLPPRARRITALVLGTGLGVLAILKMIDIGFRAVLARRFDPVLDWSLFGNGYDYMSETYGRAAAVAAVIGAVLLVLGGIGLLALAVLRLSALAAGYRKAAGGVVVGLVAAWLVFA